MAELTPGEKLQPCLLERLTDDEPKNPAESRTSRVVSLSRYRESVLRDLRWLLNANRPRLEDGVADYPEVATSVLNYGTPDVCGLTLSEMNVTELERAVEQAIKTFEPRINRNTVRVKAVREGEEGKPTTVSFEVRGELWAQPIPEKLFIRTQLDLETGRCELS